MLSAHTSRLALRQSRCLLQRRAQSSASETAAKTANKAKEGASEASAKAQQGLSRVTSSAGNVLSSASGAAMNAVSGVGGRTGSVIQRVLNLIPPTIYYAKVMGEMGKMVYQSRGMAPPSSQTIQSYLQPVRKAISNPSSVMAQSQQTVQSATQKAAANPESVALRARNIDRNTMLSAGIVAAEAVGFFCVGEMIGRFKVVGYRGGQSHGH